MIILRFKNLTLRLNPQLGGSVDSFTDDNIPILRTSISNSNNPLDQAAYPLVPFSGRIDQGKFTFNNRRVTLPHNMPPEPHAIHGQGWQSEWLIMDQSEHAATIAFDHAETEWPWRYRAEQTFELTANTLTLGMRLQNLSAVPMPAGLGWHPFFPSQGARLTADVSLIWPSGENMISHSPEHSPEVEKVKSGVLVQELDLDNAFSSNKPHAQIYWADKNRKVSLQASHELGHLVIYTPPREDFFCVEPVSHAPNCINSSLADSVTGARTLAANETMSAQIVLTVS